MSKAHFDLKKHWTDLDEEKRQVFIDTASTSRAYIANHLVNARRMPRPPLLRRLVEAANKTGASIVEGDVVMWFYSRRSKPRRARRPQLLVKVAANV